MVSAAGAELIIREGWLWQGEEQAQRFEPKQDQASSHGRWTGLGSLTATDGHLDSAARERYRFTYMRLHRYFLVLGLILACSFEAVGQSAADKKANSALDDWIDSQAKLKAWSADFVQTRSFKSLSHPLMATGHVWFAQGGKFRWELHKPARTTAVRAPGELDIIYPDLKRAEKYPLAKAKLGPWRGALQLLEAGFPTSKEQLFEQYNVLSQKVTNNVCTLVLQPKDADARKMMPQISIEFDTKGLMLVGTELEFADGSVLRNDFSHQEINPKIDDSLFKADIPADYKVVEPLKKM